MIPSGTLISIPLSILQNNIHILETGMTSNLNDMALLNVALGHSIYDGDRLYDLNDDSHFKKIYTLTTKCATLFCVYDFASRDMYFLIPLLLFLNEFYPKIKTIIAPIKPFFVGMVWTLAIYIPILDMHEQIENYLTLSSSFLLMSGFSHIADIKDKTEDARNNIITPAVIMTENEAKLFGLVCVFCSIFFHTLVENYTDLLKIEDFIIIASIIGSIL